MNKVWLYIKSNKTVVVLILVVIVLLVYIFWPVKKIEENPMNEGVSRIRDSLIQVNTFLLIQQQQEIKRKLDSLNKAANNRDVLIREKIYYRDNQIRAIDTASDAVMQSLFNERYRP